MTYIGTELSALAPNPTSSAARFPSNSTPAAALPSGITINAPETPAQVQSLRRITTLLLPIRYPDRFYNEILNDDVVRSVTRIALNEGKVVGGIRCRLEPVPEKPDSGSTPGTDVSIANPGGEQTAAERTLYIQTLVLLSPYRSLGIATALLDAVLTAAIQKYGVTSVYAHVWEANTEALEWYRRRGFQVDKGTLVGYYSRLRPNGARIVRRAVGTTEMVMALGKGERLGAD